MRKNNDWAAWRLFFRVVEIGSISKVADEVSAQPSSVSRRLTTLENDIGFKLLRRTTRTIGITEQGMRAYQQMKVLLSDMDDLIEGIADESNNLSGNIRISASVALGECVLVKWLTSFQKKHPKVTIDLILANRYVDMLKEGVDISFRIGPMTDDNVVAIPLGQTPFVVCASPEYLSQHPAPKHPHDLIYHKTLLYSGFVTQKKSVFVSKKEEIAIDLPNTFLANNLTALYQAALDGAGIHLLCPLWQCIRDIEQGRLIAVLPSWKIPPAQVNIIRLPHRQTPRRFIELSQWIAAQWSAKPGLL